MITTMEIAWLAGLLEGEGYFAWNKSWGSARVMLRMGDRDVVERAHKLCRATGVLSKIQRANPRSAIPMYEMRLYGKRAAGVMMTVYAVMGERRQAKIREILDKWKSRPTRELSAVTRRGPDGRFT